nr:11964_t:CDS:2 [Entrophospora candida]
MANVRTLQDTKSMESKKIQGQGYRLGSTREQELEKALRDSIKSNSEITSEYKNMQVVYLNHSKNTNKENDQLRRNNEKLSKNVYQLIDGVKRLRSKIDTLNSRITDKDLSLSDFKADIQALETKLSSAQKDLSMKESEIDPLRTELSALNSNLVLKNSELVHMENILASKDDKLKQMKDDLALKTSEIHSLESKLSSELIKISGKADEKKIPNSVSQSEDVFASDIYAVNKPIRDFSKFLRKKNMDKNDTPQLSVTINKVNEDTKPRNTNSSGLSNMKSSTSEGSHVDNSQIVETKDQNHTAEIEMTEILPVGALYGSW